MVAFNISQYHPFTMTVAHTHTHHFPPAPPPLRPCQRKHITSFTYAPNRREAVRQQLLVSSIAVSFPQSLAFIAKIFGNPHGIEGANEKVPGGHHPRISPMVDSIEQVIIALREAQQACKINSSLSSRLASAKPVFSSYFRLETRVSVFCGLVGKETGREKGGRGKRETGRSRGSM